MRSSILKFAEWAVEQIPIIEPIVEFGSLQVRPTGPPCNLKHMFPNREYIGADMREGPGVDKLLNLHKIDLPNNFTGTVIMLDTLEHVEFPAKALAEIYRILKPGGILIMTSCMNFPIHSYPHDYWRFTPEAFKSLLSRFDLKWVGSQGDPVFPYSVFGIAQKGPSQPGILKKIQKEYLKFKFPFEFYYFILRICPPILLTIYRKLKTENRK